MVELFYFSLASILVSITWYSWRYGITPTPTSYKVKKALLSKLPQEIEGEVTELGSGWGTLAFALARHFPSCQIYAYEISPIPYLVSIIFCFLCAYPNLKIQRRDFSCISLKKTSLVVCYLYPEAMNRLKTKFEQELSPDAYVLSHTFAIPGWSPISCIKAQDLYQTSVYLYQVKRSQPRV